MLGNFDRPISLMQFKQLPQKELENRRVSIDNFEKSSPRVVSEAYNMGIQSNQRSRHPIIVNGGSAT